jgi:hypothetical protein
MEQFRAQLTYVGLNLVGNNSCGASGPGEDDQCLFVFDHTR